MGMKEEFMQKTKMVDVHGETIGVGEVLDYLVEPTTVHKMIIASEMELPVLTLIVKELEQRFDTKSNFPFVIDGKQNATAKQNVGRMIKFVMAQYGYTPIPAGTDRMRIPAISGSKYFTTSAIYKSTENAKYKISIMSEEME